MFLLSDVVLAHGVAEEKEQSMCTGEWSSVCRAAGIGDSEHELFGHSGPIAE